MARNSATTDGGNEVKTYNLEVSEDTIINGLKRNDMPGEQRTVLFRKQIGGGHGEGTLRDVRGMHWDGGAPIQLRPREFVDEDVQSPQEARAEARRIAEEEGGDPDEAADAATGVWEDYYRGQLKDQIVVKPRFPEETKTVYNIEYVEDDE
jgi:hypothetical protein